MYIKGGERSLISEGGTQDHLREENGLLPLREKRLYPEGPIGKNEYPYSKTL